MGIEGDVALCSPFDPAAIPPPLAILIAVSLQGWSPASRHRFPSSCALSPPPHPPLHAPQRAGHTHISPLPPNSVLRNSGVASAPLLTATRGCTGPVTHALASCALMPAAAAAWVHLQAMPPPSCFTLSQSALKPSTTSVPPPYLLTSSSFAHLLLLCSPPPPLLTASSFAHRLLLCSPPPPLLTSSSFAHRLLLCSPPPPLLTSSSFAHLLLLFSPPLFTVTSRCHSNSRVRRCCRSSEGAYCSTTISDRPQLLRRLTHPAIAVLDETE
jgi:hypothetical protein